MSDQPTKYRKKPVIIDAVHWREDLTPPEAHALTNIIEHEWGYPWLVGNALRPDTLRCERQPHASERPAKGIWIDPADGALMIRTLEGDMKVSLGDYVIRDAQGEVYPCRGDIFRQAYEAVEGKVVSDLTPAKLAELRRLAATTADATTESTPWYSVDDLTDRAIESEDDAPYIAALTPPIVLELLDAAENQDILIGSVNHYKAERDALRTWQERVALAAGIADEVAGYGVYLEADPDTAAEHVAGLLAIADTHAECPTYCGGCGEPLADTPCDHCGGSGCGPGTASGAYEECGWCAGAGAVHVGCADLSYAELCAERDELAAELDHMREARDNAWDEGFQAGDDYGAAVVETHAGYRDSLPVRPENPYRPETITRDATAAPVTLAAPDAINPPPNPSAAVTEPHSTEGA